MKQVVRAALACGLIGVPAVHAQESPATLDRVEVKGARTDETAERREAATAKIVVGRDEIDRYGDTSVGEILKRLPGVVVGGAPRGGGAVRMRGLGSGYTQVLLDGERVPTGFSIDSLLPEQIERIEILRAPTAETGARSIAGTINIITRDGANRRINDLRIGAGLDRGRAQPGLSWTYGDRAGALSYNTALSLQREDRLTDSVTTIVDERLDTGAITLAQRETVRTDLQRNVASLSSRLQWQIGDGTTLALTPALSHTGDTWRREVQLEQSVGATPPPYASALADGDETATLARLGVRWQQYVGDDTRLELRANVRDARNDERAVRREADAAGTLSRTLDDRLNRRDRRYSATARLDTPLGDAHQLVGGLEGSIARRTDARTTLQDGAPILTEFGDTVQARVQRLAAYAQDEWKISPSWSSLAGLRWESITTRGDAGDGVALTNRSRVWSPLAHLRWKADDDGRDQVRLALTRSYRAPDLRDLIARPSLSTRFPVPGANQPTSPDRAGNPALRPELATGIDLAYEHYLPGSGLLSATLFQRRIRDLMRTVTTLEDVPWSNVPRWVARPQNVGNAVTQGVELEAKLQLNEIWPAAPRLDLRANVSLFRSRVEGVPAPNNRLDQQPPWTANLGADYRLRGVPLTFGTNVNFNPDYTTRLSAEQTAFQGRKTLVDAYALWTIDPSLRLRLSASNLAARRFESGGAIATDTVVETARTTLRTSILWQLRLEMKL